MLLSLFKCSVCLIPEPKHFPLCATCCRSLVPGIALCPGCGGALEVACRESCTRPWATLAPLQSLHCAYLFLGGGADLLKLWKFRQGPLLDRIVLNADDRLRADLSGIRPRAIIPIPQSFDRSWELGGSPALKIAYWLGRELGGGQDIPVVEALSIVPFQGARQTERGAEERLLRPSRFRAKIGARRFDGPVLLVDDFATTGHTLKNAARALGVGGWRDVHGFCLGLRLRRLKEEIRDLSQSA